MLVIRRVTQEGGGLFWSACYSTSVLCRMFKTKGSDGTGNSEKTSKYKVCRVSICVSYIYLCSVWTTLSSVYSLHLTFRIKVLTSCLGLWLRNAKLIAEIFRKMSFQMLLVYKHAHINFLKYCTFWKCVSKLKFSVWPMIGKIQMDYEIWTKKMFRWKPNMFMEITALLIMSRLLVNL